MPHSRFRAAAGDLLRYGMALAGPVGSAGAQFLLSLILLRQLDAEMFGRFSFLLIASQLGLGIWSALFCAALPLLIARARTEGPSDLVRATLSANFVGAIAAAAVFVGIARAIGEDWPAAALFSGFAALALLRWFARAFAYAQAQQYRVTASDVVYSAGLLAGSGLVFAHILRGTEGVYLVFLVATAGGLAVFGPRFLASQLAAFRVAHLAAYRNVWRAHGRWSLLGVVTTEATSNAHTYLVTALLGAGAYAPLAAAAVMIRPIAVVTNALVEFERARIARAIGERDLDRTKRAVRLFRTILLLAWAATGVAIIALLALDPRLIYPAAYGRTTLAIGAALWMATALARTLRTPESVLLQAGGWFRPLAFTSVWSGLFSLAGVAVLLVTAPPLWSILGIVLGETVSAALIFREARRWDMCRRAEAA